MKYEKTEKDRVQLQIKEFILKEKCSICSDEQEKELVNLYLKTFYLYHNDGNCHNE